jgi:serine protease
MNLSVSSPQISERLKRAIKNATEQGVLVVGASGNGGRSVEFPALMPEVLSVGATTPMEEVADYSSYGDAVDIAAPGGNDLLPVYSTWPSYLTSTDLGAGVSDAHTTAGLVGTSMAAPHVSGTAAVLWSVRPGLTAQQVRSALLAMADDKGTVGPDPYFGYGLLNFQRAYSGDRHDAH